SDRPTGSTSRGCASTTSASKRGTSSTSVTTSSASPSNDNARIERPLDAPVTSLPGAGPVTAGRLQERGVRTVRDLLMRLPRAYDDLRRATPIAALSQVPDGTVVLVRGIVRRLHVFPRRLLDVFVE